MATVVAASKRALCVDLDGTLVSTDLLWESLLAVARKEPLSLVRVPFWLLRGKAHLKRELALRQALNAAALPFRADVLEFLRRERRDGREIVLATAADERLAHMVSDHLGLFDAVLASDGVVNLSGARKLAGLARHCEGRGFDYIGDSRKDLPVWRAAQQAHLVNPGRSLLKQAEGVARVGEVFRTDEKPLRASFRALRLHQWVKNLLLLVPLVLSHQVGDGVLLVRAALAFLAFGLCASSVYIVNDLLDLEADRLHPNKRFRPFAAGTLSIPTGLVMAALLLAGAAFISTMLVSPAFALALLIYLTISTSYSLFIKRVVLLDVFVLAGLYTLRVVSGGVAVSVVISPWLYAFSMFVFTSLAFLKRYAELQLMQERKELGATGRGYAVGDLSFIRSVGPTCGLLAVLVLSLYVNSREVLELYAAPQLLWLAVAPIAYWITHLWFVAHRGRMHDDPIIFTFKDPTSYVVGACVAAVMLIASL